MTSLDQYIQEYFGVLKQEDLKAVTERFHNGKLQKGEYFLKQGQESNKMSFEKAGGGIG